MANWKEKEKDIGKGWDLDDRLETNLLEAHLVHTKAV